MTDLEARVAEIRARLEAATPGPWVAAPWSSGIIGSLDRSARGASIAIVTADADKLFVSHTPADVRFLLDALEGMRTDYAGAVREIAQLEQNVRDARAEVVALRTQVETLREFVRKVTWDYRGDLQWCRFCGTNRPDHATDCRARQVLENTLLGGSQT